MPKQTTVKRARAGKLASTQAGEFVGEQMRTTGRGAGRSRPHTIAIGLSEVRREGVSLPRPRKSRVQRIVPKATAFRAEPLEHEEEQRPAKRRRPPARAKAVPQRRKAARRPAAAKRRTPARPAAKRRTPARPAAKRTPARPAAKRRTRPAAKRRTAPKGAARRPAPRPATKRLVPGRRPASFVKPVITTKQAAAAKKAVAKRLSRRSPAARKGRRPHKRRTASKTIWSFDL
jgi:hypothetical protein